MAANTNAVNGLRQLLHFRSDLATTSAGTPTATDGSPLITLQLLSLTLAYDDTRFFGSVMFTDPDQPDDKPATVLIDHADAPPGSASRTSTRGQDPTAPAMVEADRIMRFLLRYTPSASAARPPTSPNHDSPCSRPTLGGSC